MTRAGTIYGALAAIAAGRPSLRFVIVASMVLAWIALALFVYMMGFRTYHRLRSMYRLRRRALYEPAIEKVLLEASLEEVLAALAPRQPSDAAIAQEVMTEAMRNLNGSPFETLRTAAYQLGFMERNLQLLDSRSKFRRGQALEALGLMRAPQAVVKIISILGREPMDMKLVALRSLAAIGDPATLPYFVATAQKLSPAMLPRVASLMWEFGPPSR
ncbi:MAG: hypothetical protein WC881_02805, partial [Elusimicrobiota bacterium]